MNSIQTSHFRHCLNFDNLGGYLFRWLGELGALATVVLGVRQFEVWAPGAVGAELTYTDCTRGQFSDVRCMYTGAVWAPACAVKGRGLPDP
jgi:hypothetical protein